MLHAPFITKLTRLVLNGTANFDSDIAVHRAVYLIDQAQELKNLETRNQVGQRKLHFEVSKDMIITASCQ